MHLSSYQSSITLTSFLLYSCSVCFHSLSLLSSLFFSIAHFIFILPLFVHFLLLFTHPFIFFILFSYPYYVFFSHNICTLLSRVISHFIYSRSESPFIHPTSSLLFSRLIFYYFILFFTIRFSSGIFLIFPPTTLLSFHLFFSPVTSVFRFTFVSFSTRTLNLLFILTVIPRITFLFFVVFWLSHLHAIHVVPVFLIAILILFMLYSPFTISHTQLHPDS